MDTGIQLIWMGMILVTSLLLRNAAARHVTPEMVPAVLRARLLLRNRTAPAILALTTAAMLGVLAVLVASQIATAL